MSTGGRGSLDEILNDMHELKGQFENCRAFFPYSGADAIGRVRIETAPRYQLQGYHTVFYFEGGAKREDIERMNRGGHWLNQNFVIRLYGILNEYGVVGEDTKINPRLQGREHLDILRRVRNNLVHSTGKGRDRSADTVKLIATMNELYKLNLPSLVDIPLAIDTVLDPMFVGCKEYVTGFYRGHQA